MELNWYWLDGAAYCPRCVDCESPAIEADADGVTRGPKGAGCCACCGTRAGGYYVLEDVTSPSMRCLLADGDRVAVIAPESPLVRRFATFSDALDYPRLLGLSPRFVKGGER
jgi:hypothetical protein